MRRLLEKTEQALTHFAALLAALGLAAMLIFSLLQIITRNLFNYSLPGSETLLGYLVLWVAMIGAVLAVRPRRHVKIDLGPAWLGERFSARVAAWLNVFSTIVCALLAWAAMRFWWQEWVHANPESRGVVLLSLILPSGFFLLTVHFLLRSVLDRQTWR